MNCKESEVYVSAVCDAEPVPAHAAEHIRACATCRAVLAEYARMGTELRLAASAECVTLPPLELPARRPWFDYFLRRVAVPRFALAALIVALLGAAVAVPLVRAQPKPLWFQFGYSLESRGETGSYSVAKPGFDETSATMMMTADGVMRSAYFRIRVESVSDNEVVLRCRAVAGTTEKHAGGETLLPPPRDLSFGNSPALRYRPGQELAIPVEGGGAVYLRGEVQATQPKIAFGRPLEPAANQLVMREAVLISRDGGQATHIGGTATADRGYAVEAAGEHGRLVFALEPFPGAVEGKIEWGRMRFAVDNKAFELVAAAPFTGGEQPRPVWVRYDPTPVGSGWHGTVSLAQQGH